MRFTTQYYQYIQLEARDATVTFWNDEQAVGEHVLEEQKLLHPAVANN